MSWSVQTVRPVVKDKVDAEIDSLYPSYELDGPPVDQLRIAKQAAKLLVANVPGPFIQIILSGHANGAGWNKKGGMANDSITVTVSQIHEDDLKHYPSPKTV